MFGKTHTLVYDGIPESIRRIAVFWLNIQYNYCLKAEWLSPEQNVWNTFKRMISFDNDSIVYTLFAI